MYVIYQQLTVTSLNGYCLKPAEIEPDYCPSECETCKGGPCERYCSTHNWCGDKDTHGGSLLTGWIGTDCTGCAFCTFFYISFIQKAQ